MPFNVGDKVWIQKGNWHTENGKVFIGWFKPGEIVAVRPGSKKPYRVRYEQRTTGPAECWATDEYGELKPRVEGEPAPSTESRRGA